MDFTILLFGILSFYLGFWVATCVYRPRFAASAPHETDYCLERDDRDNLLGRKKREPWYVWSTFRTPGSHPIPIVRRAWEDGRYDFDYFNVAILREAKEDGWNQVESSNGEIKNNCSPLAILGRGLRGFVDVDAVAEIVFYLRERTEKGLFCADNLVLANYDFTDRAYLKVINLEIMMNPSDDPGVPSLWIKYNARIFQQEEEESSSSSSDESEA